MGADRPGGSIRLSPAPATTDAERTAVDTSRDQQSTENEKLAIELASAKVDLEQKTVNLAETRRDLSAPGRWSRVFAGSVPIMVGLLTAFIGWNVTLLGEHAKQTTDAFAKSAADALAPGDPGLRLRGAISLYDLAKSEEPATSSRSLVGALGRVAFGSQEYVADQAVAILSRRLASETDLAVLEELADLLGTLPISIDDVISENRRAQIALARAVGYYAAASTVNGPADRLDCNLSATAAGRPESRIRRMLANVAARPLAHDDKFLEDDRLADLIGLLSTDKLCGYMQTEYASDRLRVPGVALNALNVEVRDAVAATRSLFATSLILEMLLKHNRFDINTDFSGIAFMDAHMRFADLRSLTLSNAFFSGDFSSADFESSVMGMADLRFAKLFSIDHGNEYKLEEAFLLANRPGFIAQNAWYDTHFKGAVIYAMRLPDLRSQEMAFRKHQCNNPTIRNVYPPDFSGIRWWNIAKDRTSAKPLAIAGFTANVWKMRYPKEAFDKKLDVAYPTKSLCRPLPQKAGRHQGRRSSRSRAAI